MRDPARIPVILAELARVWEKNPDMRLGQLVEVAAARLNQRDAFYIEDEALVAAMNREVPP